MSYYTKITKAGLAAITAAMNNSSKVPITYMAFGDGNGYIPEPDENAASLVNEVYRVGVNKVEVHSKNPNWLVCEAIIPSAVGGFNIREVALYDSTGNTMLAIASYPPTYKPTVEEGAAKIQTIRIVIQVDNSGNFELIVDPDVVLATVDYVDEKTQQMMPYVFEQNEIKTYKKAKLHQALLLCGNSVFYSSDAPNLSDDGCMTFLSDDGTFWKRGTSGSINLSYFGNTTDAKSAFEKLFIWVKTNLSAYTDNGQGIRKINVDLDGLVWETSHPIFGVQGIGGLNFINGHVKAKDDFVGDYLFEFTDDNALRAYHYITFNHIIFDANRKTNCFRINRVLKSGFTTCHFLRWKENGYGLVVGKTSTDTLGASEEAHEVFVNGQCSFAQYDFAARYNGQICTGIALYINTYDGHYSDFFIAGAGRGIVHDKCGLNIFSNIHIYGINEPDYGFFADCTGVNSFLNIDNMYFDGCSFRALNPNQITITTNKIFRSDETNKALIIFDTSANNNYAKRIVITQNHFNTANPSGRNQIDFITESGGSWLIGGEHDIQSFANTNLGYVKLYTTAASDQTDWREWNGFTFNGKYALDKTGSFTFDLSQYHRSLRSNNASAVPSEWIISSTWQSVNGSSVGLYKLIAYRLPNGKYYGVFEPVGTALKSISTYSEEMIDGVLTKKVTTLTEKEIPVGFNSPPTLSENGVVSVNLSNFFRGAIYRCDTRNLG
ncbi:MAG: phage tail protein [Acinetobacter johnsonii]